LTCAGFRPKRRKILAEMPNPLNTPFRKERRIRHAFEHAEKPGRGAQRVGLQRGLPLPSDGRRPEGVRSLFSLLLLICFSLSVNVALHLHNELVAAALRAALDAAEAPGAMMREDIVVGDRKPTISGINGVDEGATSEFRDGAAVDGAGRLRHAHLALPSVRAPRTFRVQQSRADYRVTVTDALVSLGLAPTNETFALDVFWGHEWVRHAAYADRRLADHALVSSVMGLTAEAVGDKEFLGYALQLCMAQHGSHVCDFVAPIYLLPTQEEAWRAAYKRHRYWIRKDKKLWGSQGVSIVSSRRDLPKDMSYLLQKYVSNPLLWDGYKHDIRLWAVLTSMHPLRLFLLHDGWGRLAARRYNVSDIRSSAKDECVHLTTTYCTDDASTSLRLMRTRLHKYRSALQLPLRGDGADANTHFETALWPSIRRAVVKSVLMVWPLLAGYEQSLHAQGLSYARFAFLSYDVILTRAGYAYIEEVNTNGFLMGSRIPYGWEYTLDAAHLLGLSGHPNRSRYAPKLQRELEAFCDDAVCSPREVAQLAALVDETEHAGQFARVFPPSDAAEMRALQRLVDPRRVSRLDHLSHKFAVHFYGATEAAVVARLLAPQRESASDSTRWDWFGLSGNWKREKVAVRQENRKLMESIQKARLQEGVV